MRFGLSVYRRGNRFIKFVNNAEVVQRNKEVYDVRTTSSRKPALHQHAGHYETGGYIQLLQDTTPYPLHVP